jgi:4-amino-4-deoxy-L-arabinose transferase-like glycosyltransferase
MTRRRIPLDWLALASVLILATALRLYRLDLLDLRFDEATALRQAMQIARGEWLPVAPFSGSVANHPPTYLYIMALPYLFTRDFLTVAAYRVLLDVVAIALCWGLCRRFFSGSLGVALIACLIFATAPWAIQFARRTWLAALPLFQVILLFGLLEALARRNPWGWAIAGWGLALSAGAHLSAIYLLPVALIAVALGRQTLRLPPLLVGGVPLVVLAMAYLGFDAGQDFRNLRALLGSAGEPSAWSPHAIRFALWISGGTHLSDLTGGAYLLWRQQPWLVLEWVDTLQMALLVMSAGALLAQLVSRRASNDASAIVILLAWLILPVLLQSRPSRPLQMHYFLALYPVPFVVTGLGLTAIVQGFRSLAMRRAVSAATGGALALVAAWQVHTTLQFTAFIERHDTGAGGYGPPARGALEVARLARETIRSGRASDVIVLTMGGDPTFHEASAVMDVVLADLPRRFADPRAGLILREDGAQYVITPEASAALDALNVHSGGDLRVQAIPLRNGRADAYHHVWLSRAALGALRPWPAQWEIGVGMLGYRLTLDHALTLDYYLRVFRQPPPGANYHWFHHVFKDGQKFAALDGSGIRTADWRVGDILFHRFVIPLPESPPARPYELHLGAYLYPQVERVRLLNPAGQPEGDYTALVVE